MSINVTVNIGIFWNLPDDISEMDSMATALVRSGKPSVLSLISKSPGEHFLRPKLKIINFPDLNSLHLIEYLT